PVTATPGDPSGATPPQPNREQNPVLHAIRTRRVVRNLTPEPIARAELETILRAARFAPSAGNRRLQRFVAILDPLTLRLLRFVSPGMLQRPAAAVLICIDWECVDAFEIPRDNRGVYIDVGSAAQTMLLAAHALGLASGPVTSFSKEAVRAILALPPRLTPEMLLCFGHEAPGGPAPIKTASSQSWRDLVQWERSDR